MLSPAILYKDQIQKEFQKYYYTTDMMYETGCLDSWNPNICENPDEQTYQYAIVGNDSELIGFLAFRIDWYCSRVYNFGLFSFDRGNVLIGREVFHKLDELVNRFHRVEWRAVSGNPACKSYDNFIKKYNGSKHVLKDAIRDRAGNYHNDIIYEIVKDGVADAGKRGKSEDAEELRSNSGATSKWIPCSERLPEPDEYVLLSFSNYSGLMLGRYEEDDGGGAFYEGDSLTPLTQYDAFVNAWMPLPKPYREVE